MKKIDKQKVHSKWKSNCQKRNSAYYKLRGRVGIKSKFYQNNNVVQIILSLTHTATRTGRYKVAVHLKIVFLMFNNPWMFHI